MSIEPNNVSQARLFIERLTQALIHRLNRDTAPKQTSEGWLLIDKDRYNNPLSDLFSFGIGLTLTVLGVVYIIAGFFPESRQHLQHLFGVTPDVVEPQNAEYFIEWGGVFGGILLLLIGSILFAVGYSNLRLQWCWSPGKLLLSDWPLQQNKTTVLKYVRRSRHPRLLPEGGQVTIRLYCEYGYRTRDTDGNEETISSLVFEEQLPVFLQISQSFLEARCNVAPPVDQPISEGYYRWQVEVSVNIPGMPSDVSVFLLTVRSLIS